MVSRGQRRTEDGEQSHRRIGDGNPRLKEDRGWQADTRGGQTMVSRGQRRTDDGEQRLK